MNYAHYARIKKERKGINDDEKLRKCDAVIILAETSCDIETADNETVKLVLKLTPDIFLVH